MYLPIILIFIFSALFLIPIHSESIIPLNNTISGTFHDWKISLTFNDSVVSGTINNNDDIISFDNIKVIDRRDRFYIFDKDNNLKIFSKQINENKYLVLVKYSDTKFRFITNIDEPNVKEQRVITGQRNLLETINELEKESKELSWKEQQLLKKQKLIKSALEQRELDIKNLIGSNYKKDFGTLSKEDILNKYSKYKTQTNTAATNTTTNTNNRIISENNIQSFLSVPINIEWRKELKFTVLITDDIKQTYNTNYNSWIGNKLNDVTITGKITSPSNDILYTFNGTTNSNGGYSNKFLIPERSTTRGEYTVSINAEKIFRGNTIAETTTSKTFFVTSIKDSSFNNPPIANAGIDRHNSTGSLVMLDGSASHDLENSILHYAWTQINGTRITLSNYTVVNPTFRIPDTVDLFGFSLLVNDGRKNSLKSDSVIISSLHSSAGANQTHTNGTKGFIVNSTKIQLDGSKSGDSLPDHTISYLWTILDKFIPTNNTITTANLTDNTIVNPKFTPDRFGNYTIQLKVTDSVGLSDISNVTINVKNSTS